MQRRIQKLLTGGSRISVTCIAANPHLQSIIQSRFLLRASFFFHVFIVVSVLQKVHETNTLLGGLYLSQHQKCFLFEYCVPGV